MGGYERYYIPSYEVGLEQPELTRVVNKVERYQPVDVTQAYYILYTWQ